MENYMERLKSIRKEIDEIDERIIYLISRRIGYAREIAHLKMELGCPVEDEKREREIRERVYKLCKNYDLDFETVWGVVKTLVEYSKRVQREEVNKKNKKIFLKGI